MVSLIKVHGFKAAKRHVGKTKTEKETRSARPWRRKRERVLQRDKYKCRSCGNVSDTLEVDHILPLAKGGTDDEKNLQALCSLCHMVKTASENALQNATMIPAWMPVSHLPLVLVCGRPAAGKSTYVSNHKLKFDTVIDLDLIAGEMNKKLHEFSKIERNALIRIRNNRIASYIRGETDYKKCWVVTSAGYPHIREYWQKRGAEVVVIDTAIHICERRIHARDIPAYRKEESLAAVHSWK